MRKESFVGRAASLVYKLSVAAFRKKIGYTPACLLKDAAGGHRSRSRLAVPYQHASMDSQAYNDDVDFLVATEGGNYSDRLRLSDMHENLQYWPHRPQLRSL